ncbi:MAG: hypothetical protein AAFV53_33360 [Myxococcota bacterium]
MRTPLLVASLAIGLGLSGQARATSLYKLSNAQLVDASELIVRGTVTEVWTEKDERGVWTHAQVEVQRVLKGDPSTELIVLEQMGGIWSSEATLVEGVARFDVGEEAYFFVEHLNSNRSVPVGMFQGKFNVLIDPYTREEIVHRYHVPVRMDYDHRFLPLPAEADRVEIYDFEDQIRERMLLGWDGNPIPGVSNEKLRRISPAQTIDLEGASR